MFFANASSEALQKANPSIELGIAVICLVATLLIWLDVVLRNRKNSAKWTRHQLLKCLAPLAAGLMFLAFYLTD